MQVLGSAARHLDDGYVANIWDCTKTNLIHGVIITLGSVHTNNAALAEIGCKGGSLSRTDPGVRSFKRLWVLSTIVSLEANYDHWPIIRTHFVAPSSSSYRSLSVFLTIFWSNCSVFQANSTQSCLFFAIFLPQTLNHIRHSVEDRESTWKAASCVDSVKFVPQWLCKCWTMHHFTVLD